MIRKNIILTIVTFSHSHILTIELTLHPHVPE